MHWERADNVADEKKSFKAGIDFPSVLRIISKQIYETPLAFNRENVQNAVDAVRIQAYRDQKQSSDAGYRIDITVEDRVIRVRDNGTGMSADDLRNFFWTIGASGKRTQEALAAGCVGTFGIGGFANFGMCEALDVTSQTEGAAEGTLTRLSEKDIDNAGGAIPDVTMQSSNDAAPRGTLVAGYLRETPNIDQLRNYLRDFVRYVPTAIYFNGDKVAQRNLSDLEDRQNFTEISRGSQKWQSGDLTITGRLYEDRGHALTAKPSISSVTCASKAVRSMCSSAASSFARRKSARRSAYRGGLIATASFQRQGGTRLMVTPPACWAGLPRQWNASPLKRFWRARNGSRSTPASFAISSGKA
jgi:hypothetical protein